MIADHYMRYLAGSTLTAAAATQTVTVAACELLNIEIVIPLFTVSDTPYLQFNSDTGSNYHYSYQSSAAAATTFTNTSTNSTTKAFLSPNASANCHCIWITLTNSAQAVTKAGAVQVFQGTAGVGTTGNIIFGGFEWVNTTAQITTILLGGSAGNTLGIGTSIRVTGMDFL